jgi:hypothetical protein
MFFKPQPHTNKRRSGIRFCALTRGDETSHKSKATMKSIFSWLDDGNMDFVEIIENMGVVDLV